MDRPKGRRPQRQPSVGRGNTYRKGSARRNTPRFWPTGRCAQLADGARLLRGRRHRRQPAHLADPKVAPICAVGGALSAVAAHRANRRAAWWLLVAALVLGVLRGKIGDPGPTHSWVRGQTGAVVVTSTSASTPGPRCELGVRGDISFATEPGGLPRSKPVRCSFFLPMRGGAVSAKRFLFPTARYRARRPVRAWRRIDRVGGSYSRWVAQLRADAWSSSRGDPELGLVVAAALGLRASLPPEHRDALRAAGMGHLIAVSGLHVGVAALFLHFALLRVAWLLGSSPRWAGLCSMLPVLAYVGITGAAPSAVRAAAMLGVLALASRPAAAARVVHAGGRGGGDVGRVPELVDRTRLSAVDGSDGRDPDRRRRCGDREALLARDVGGGAGQLAALWSSLGLRSVLESVGDPHLHTVGAAGRRVRGCCCRRCGQRPSSRHEPARGCCSTWRLCSMVSRGSRHGGSPRPGWRASWSRCCFRAIDGRAPAGGCPLDSRCSPGLVPLLERPPADVATWYAVGSKREMSMVVPHHARPGAVCIDRPRRVPGDWLRLLDAIGARAVVAVRDDDVGLAPQLVDALDRRGRWRPGPAACPRVASEPARQALDACLRRRGDRRALVRGRLDGAGIECFSAGEWRGLLAC